nr:hypothetical protein 1 [Desulfobulbaceae bacterium]
MGDDMHYPMNPLACSFELASSKMLIGTSDSSTYVMLTRRCLTAPMGGDIRYAGGDVVLNLVIIANK